jgi:hypothetical protein
MLSKYKSQALTSYAICTSLQFISQSAGLPKARNSKLPSYPLTSLLHFAPTPTRILQESSTQHNTCSPTALQRNTARSPHPAMSSGLVAPSADRSVLPVQLGFLYSARPGKLTGVVHCIAGSRRFGLPVSVSTTERAGRGKGESGVSASRARFVGAQQE